MSSTDKISAKEIFIAIAVLAAFAAAMLYTLSAFTAEGIATSEVISDQGDTSPIHVKAHVKLVSIDPTKGDLTARIEFTPSDTLTLADGTLKQPLKLYINSGNSKQETDFAKGRRMTPVEGVFNMEDGEATEYPFDKHSADIEIYLSKPPAEKKKKPAPKPSPETKPVDTAKHAATTTAKPAAPNAKPAVTKVNENDEDAEDDEDNEIPLSVDFFGSIPGYKIDAEKGKESEIDYVVIETQVERSGTVKFFSIFVAALMWALTIGVLFFLMAVVVRGRKVELGMFSFFAALLFAFYAVRNSQPNIPPIGVYSDFIAFFWAEIIIALCLLIGLMVWILRPSK